MFHPLLNTRRGCVALLILYSCPFHSWTTNIISTITTLQFLLDYSSKHHLLSRSQDVHQLFLSWLIVCICVLTTPRAPIRVSFIGNFCLLRKTIINQLLEIKASYSLCADIDLQSTKYENHGERQYNLKKKSVQRNSLFVLHWKVTAAWVLAASTADCRMKLIVFICVNLM